MAHEYPTLANVLATMDPNGAPAAMAEILHKKNQCLEDIYWMPTNQELSHVESIRTSLGSPEWRGFNEGVDFSTATSEPITEPTAMLEDWSQIDEDLAAINGNTASWRAQHDRALIESMAQEMALTWFNGNRATSPKSLDGLSKRFAEANSDEDHHGSQLINGGGSGSDNCSIWMYVNGPEGVFGLYPKGSMAGLKVDADAEAKTVYDSNSKPFKGFQTHYQWKPGICIKNWRNVVRICNIDVSDLTDDASTGAVLYNLMARAVERLDDSDGRVGIYVNPTISTKLRLQIMNKSNAHLSFEDFDGKRVMAFDGHPIRRVSRKTLLNTEATVTGTFMAD